MNVSLAGISNHSLYATQTGSARQSAAEKPNDDANGVDSDHDGDGGGAARSAQVSGASGHTVNTWA